jgi:hypothetical protein
MAGPMNRKGFGRKWSWNIKRTVLVLPGGIEENHELTIATAEI